MPKDNLNYERAPDEEDPVGDTEDSAKITSKSIEFIPSLLSAPKPRRAGPKSLSKSLPLQTGPKAIIENGRYQIEKPDILLMDIWNIIAQFPFSQKIEKFIDEKLPAFVSDNFENRFVKDVIDQLIADNETRRICNPLLPPITRTGSHSEQINSLLENIQYRRKHEPETICISEPIIDRIVLQGFQTHELKPSIFDDVTQFIEWSNHNIRMYTLDNSTEAYQRNFLKAAGFDEAIFAGHYNSKAEYRATDFANLAKDIKARPKSMFYLTSSFNRAREAAKAGISSVLILRDHGECKYSNAQLATHLVVKTLKEIDFSSATK